MLSFLLLLLSTCGGTLIPTQTTEYSLADGTHSLPKETPTPFRLMVLLGRSEGLGVPALSVSQRSRAPIRREKSWTLRYMDTAVR